MGSVLDYINPFRYFTEEQYSSFWQSLFATVLSGFWARILVVFFVGFAIWVVIKRDRLMTGLIFFLIAIFIAYGSNLLRVLNI